MKKVAIIALFGLCKYSMAQRVAQSESEDVVTFSEESQGPQIYYSMVQSVAPVQESYASGGMYEMHEVYYAESQVVSAATEKEEFMQFDQPPVYVESFQTVTTQSEEMHLLTVEQVVVETVAIENLVVVESVPVQKPTPTKPTSGQKPAPGKSTSGQKPVTVQPKPVQTVPVQKPGYEKPAPVKPTPSKGTNKSSDRSRKNESKRNSSKSNKDSDSDSCSGSSSKKSGYTITRSSCFKKVHYYRKYSE